MATKLEGGWGGTKDLSGLGREVFLLRLPLFYCRDKEEDRDILAIKKLSKFLFMEFIKVNPTEGSPSPSELKFSRTCPPSQVRKVLFLRQYAAICTMRKFHKSFE